MRLTVAAPAFKRRQQRPCTGGVVWVVLGFFCLNLCWYLFVGGAREESGRFAFVTLAAGDGYAEGAVVLARSLESVRSRYSLVVMVTPEVSPSALSALKREPRVSSVVPVSELSLPAGLKTAQHRWIKAFTKIRAFQLSRTHPQLERVAFVDTDAMFLKNPDDVFLAWPGEPFVAASDPDLGVCQQRPLGTMGLNSGVLLFAPSERMFRDTVAQIERLAVERADTTVNDQDVLAVAFPAWKPLDYPSWGGHVVHCHCPDFSTKVLHFTAGTKKLAKPWSSEVNFTSFEPCVRDFFAKWRSLRQARL